MKRISLLALALCTALLMAADAGDKLKGIKCPISGGPAKAGTEVAYKGGKVYFCCENCPKAFAKDTEKHSTKANHQLFATKQAQSVKCVISGRDLDPSTAIEVAGTKVAFCCNNCKGKVAAASGDEQLNLVFSNAAFAKGFKVPKKEKK